MSEKTEIVWCDSTFNPWIGCTKVGPGCDHCYAEADFGARKGRAVWGPGEPRSRTSAANWALPLRWERKHEEFFREHGRRQRVFCASLADVFDNEVDPAWRAELFALIWWTPHLDWLLLTKRIGNVPKMIDASDMDARGIPPNVWLGATICNQEEADRDIPKLLATPASRRFLSMEPLLGPVDLRRVCEFSSGALGRFVDSLVGHRWDESGYAGGGPPLATDPPDIPRLDWVIVGGESGPHARPMHPDWVRGLRDQCAAAGVPFTFKQWGEYVEWTGAESPSPSRRMPDMTPMVLVGKKAAGRLLDGREWDGVPT